MSKLHAPPGYYFAWGERHSVMTAEAWPASYLRYRSIIANDNRDMIVVVQSGDVTSFNATADLAIAHEAGKILLEPNFLKEYLAGSSGVRTRFQALVDDVNAGLEPAKLRGLFDRYITLYEEVYARYKITQPEYLEPAYEALKTFLSQNELRGHDLEVAVARLCAPLTHDIVAQEELGAIEAALDQKITDETVQKHAAAFPWLFWNTYDRATIEAFLREKFHELKATKSEDRRKRRTEIEYRPIAYAKERNALLDTLTHERAEIDRLSAMFGQLAVDRYELKSWWAGGEYLCLPLFEAIAEQSTLPVKTLLMGYRADEVVALLERNVRVSASVLADRRELYVIRIQGDRLEFIERDDAQPFVRLETGESESAAQKTIRGTVASPGTVRGKVRIVQVQDLEQLLNDAENFIEGDILVTTMTQPSMTILGRKAAAIVTNEGGITSHAALLAREFGIPCIVGTKVATALLNNGDLIEVDGATGNVRIIIRASKTNAMM